MSMMYKVEQTLLQVLEDEKQEILGAKYPEDRITEIVDGCVPIYHSDLAEMFAEDYSLGFVDDAGLLPENPDVFQVISISIYERLSDIAFQWLDDNLPN